MNKDHELPKTKKKPKKGKAFVKRKFHGNRHILKRNSTGTSVENVLPAASTSPVEPPSPKRLKIHEAGGSSEDNIDNCYVFFHFKILSDMFGQFSFCPECGSPLQMKRCPDENRSGYAIPIEIKCIKCTFTDKFWNSPEIPSPQTSGMNSFDINFRIIMAFREFGKGYDAINTFTSLMNMPPPMAIRIYNSINEKLRNVYMNSAEDNMKEAGNEVRKIVSPETADETPIDCQVSIDGSWHKQSYSSMHGVVTAVAHANTKVIDSQVLSKYCKGCETWEKRRNTPAFEEWQSNHVCSINYQVKGHPVRWNLQVH